MPLRRRTKRRLVIAMLVISVLVAATLASAGAITDGTSVGLLATLKAWLRL